MENIDFNLKGLVAVTAVGIPALLIVLGFFGYIGGLTFATITGNSEMKGTGTIMMIVGVALYLVELLVYVAISYNNRNNGYY